MLWKKFNISSNQVEIVSISRLAETYISLSAGIKQEWRSQGVGKADMAFILVCGMLVYSDYSYSYIYMGVNI